ncbi:MAG TPA: MBL fold metallo-hydrolase [Candidatus Faecalibacterium faecipullorum]|uniref:MBL fold metallo-hydrolase n=1 Tax=Candidatus Faecalibacterium faecipullorum TaxID=2838578 RepID=A0A9D2S7Q0_9FIRM|nr:MBL fold metallo-hydrolase [Candidatus Faecalibacterium faecipullorum]
MMDRPHKRPRAARLLGRLAALALAAALTLSLAGCEELLAMVQQAQNAPPAASQPAPPAEGGGFSVTFIDVGQALSVLVGCDGQYMLYDGGNVEDGSLVVSYLQSRGVDRLEYVFCSHAHEDHVGGLAAVMAAVPAGQVYAPVTENDTQCFEDFVKYTQQQGLAIVVPAAGSVWQLGSAVIRMLGPVASYDDTNDTSLVLRIDYGETSFLLTGDMEQDAEDDLVASGAPLDVDVLQVGHHGSETSTGYVFLNAVLPEIGVISVGEGNSYGHPHEAALSRLRDAGVDVWRTDLSGTITITSDGADYAVASERYVPPEQQNPTTSDGSGQQSSSQQTIQAYIGNVNSKKFHLPSCPNLPDAANQTLFSSYEEAVQAGYTPCGNCLG